MTALVDPVLLATFVAVVRAQSFTRAAESLGLGQSTVSQHVQRLERAVGRRLIARDTHSFSLTVEGETVLAFARTVLGAHTQLAQTLDAAKVRGRVRFGASEDVVQSRLAAVLRDFVRQHPSVDLELTVALSGVLHEALARGELDLVLAKRRLGEARGALVRRERLAWVARTTTPPDRGSPVPLITFPAPSVTRAIALEALAAAGRAWRITCTCASLSGLRAGALAGLGVMVQPASLIPDGLYELGPGHDLPPLSDIEFVIAGPGMDREPSRTLAAVIQVADIWA